MYCDALRHAMRMSLWSCWVWERVVVENAVDLTELLGRSNVIFEIKRRGRDRDGS